MIGEPEFRDAWAVVVVTSALAIVVPLSVDGGDPVAVGRGAAGRAGA